MKKIFAIVTTVLMAVTSFSSLGTTVLPQMNQVEAAGEPAPHTPMPFPETSGDSFYVSADIGDNANNGRSPEFPKPRRAARVNRA